MSGRKYQMKTWFMKRVTKTSKFAPVEEQGKVILPERMLRLMEDSTDWYWLYWHDTSSFSFYKELSELENALHLTGITTKNLDSKIIYFGRTGDAVYNYID